MASGEGKSTNKKDLALMAMAYGSVYVARVAFGAKDAQTVKAFQEAKDDSQVRRYLALAIGRLDPPLPAEAIADLTRALDDPDSETRISVIWALGSSGDAAVVPRLVTLFTAQDADAGIRKMPKVPGHQVLHAVHRGDPRVRRIHPRLSR